jgi:predicted P-loop ATPase
MTNFTGDISTMKNDKRVEWDDSASIDLMIKLQRGFGLHNLKIQTVRNAIAHFGMRHTTNEPLDWMETKKWDGIERIDHMLTDIFGAAGTAYVRAVSRNLLIMICARVYRPGCQVDNMVVLVGPQGQYKSTALERLCGPNMFMVAHSAVTNKDFFIDLQGKMITEIAELDAFSKAEASRVKQVLSTKSDRFRAPYATTAQDHPRQGIFLGTTNEDAFLKDSTGNRRYWIIRCVGEINLDALIEQRDQLFAEAVHELKRGEYGKNRLSGTTWWDVPEVEAAEIEEDYFDTDEWEAIFKEYLLHRNKVRLTEVLSVAVGLEVAKQDKETQRRAGAIMRRLKFKRTQKRNDSGKNERVWVRTE